MIKFFFEYLQPYLLKLKERVGDNFVVFGSAPLYLYGIVKFDGKINDLDISLKDTKDIPNDAQIVTFHKDKNQLFYKITINDLNIDMCSLWSGYEYYFNKIHSDPVVINGFKFANIDIIREWKELMVNKYNRQKDIDYLEKINNFKFDKNY